MVDRDKASSAPPVQISQNPPFHLAGSSLIRLTHVDANLEDLKPRRARRIEA